MGYMSIAQSPAALLPDDILTAILVLAKQESEGERRLAFRGHDSALQRVFLRLAQECRSALLGVFVFSDSGPEPYSPALSEAISRLQLSGLVGRENPDYEVLFLRPSAEKYFQDELRARLSGQEIAELRGVARRFLEAASLK